MFPESLEEEGERLYFGMRSGRCFSFPRLRVPVPWLQFSSWLLSLEQNSPSQEFWDKTGETSAHVEQLGRDPAVGIPLE